VSKCWDIAIQQMRKGQITKLLCPHQLDKGGSVNNFRQSGTAWIPEGTDITYEIEVNDCDKQLIVPNETMMPSKTCIFIVG